MREHKDPKILVIGDIMLDKYVVGDVERISPEAPVPVVRVTQEYNNLGGCGNVVRNLRSIGVECSCLAAVGNDLEGQVIIQELENIGAVSNLIVIPDRKTTVKERIVAGERQTQMLRIDRETTEKVDSKYLFTELDKIKLKDYDCVLISDYGKGMIHDRFLLRYLKTFPFKIIVDPKPSNINLYYDAYMITPNEKEFAQIIKSPGSNWVLETIDYILETRGRNGIRVYNQKVMNFEDIPTTPVDVFNVSGAGDCVLAVVGACTSLGIDAVSSAKVANDCAGFVVTKPGTSVVSENKFIESVSKYCK